jgi:fatty-acyl-CoA synthase
VIYENLHRPLYGADVLANALNNYPDIPLLRQLDGPTLSVREMRDETSRFIQALQSVGVTPESCVSMLASNLPETLHIGHATSMIPVLSVPIHAMSSLADQLNIVRDAGVNVLIFEAERFEKAAADIKAAEPGITLLAVGPSEIAPDIRKLAASFEPKKLVPPVIDGDYIGRRSYSGGTTGKPKAIPSAARSGKECASIIMSEWEWPLQPHVLSCAPLTHAGGTMFTPALLKGGTFLILPSFDPLQVLQCIQGYRINCMMLVPTMIYALLDHPRFDEFDLSSLETVFYGASLMNPVRLKEAIERIGPVFAQFYGQAEAPMVLTYFRKGDHDVNDMNRLASCGLPCPYVRLELHDAEGNEVPDGEPGEIVVQGPLVMNGYLDEELNKEVFKHGWLHTGDVAVRDPDGFLRIVDRVKDMIVSGGFNIYPREVEMVIAAHPAVAEVAVIGVPHDKWGEAVKAVVVTKPGQSVAEDDLIAMVAEAKGSYQAPKSVLFVEAIPQTPVGKPDKKALRAVYA